MIGRKRYKMIPNYLVLVILVVILGVFFWFTRPIWHGVLMMFYLLPFLWESIIGAVAVMILLHFWRFSGDKSLTFWMSFVFFIIILAPLMKMYPKCHLGQTLKASRIVELPEVDSSALRVIPRIVSFRYAEDALQYPQFRLGTGDIGFIGNTPYWVYGLIPGGLINSFILKNKGAVYVNMNSLEKDIRIIEKEMEIGEGMGITDWYKWRLYKRRYWINCGDPYFVFSQGNLYLVVPIISYKYYWRFPTFYTVPLWEGVALINSKGKIEFLTPKQAQAHPVLEGQKLFPDWLARFYVESFEYTHGILNALFFHQEQLEIAEVPGQQNEQPFLVVTKKGIKWLIACEPFGKAHGIFRIYLIDARNGKIELYEESKNAGLIGPVSACNYIRKANPRVDWSQMRPVEPIPLIIEGRLYWQVSVIPKDASGIAYTAMINAKTGEVRELMAEEIKEFVKGKRIKEIGVSKPRTRKKGVATIVIRKDGKEINRIKLFPDQKQRIEIILTP